MNLKEYKFKYKLSNTELARRFKVCNATVTEWIKGKHTPIRRHQELIHTKTKGEVSFDDWKKYNNTNPINTGIDNIHPSKEQNEE